MSIRSLLLFAAGVVVGLLLASGSLASGDKGPRVVGETGWLSGYEVRGRDGRICSDPYYWETTRTIQCGGVPPAP